MKLFILLVLLFAPLGATAQIYNPPQGTATSSEVATLRQQVQTAQAAADTATAAATTAQTAANAAVKKVNGSNPDGTGNVALPTTFTSTTCSSCIMSSPIFTGSATLNGGNIARNLYVATSSATVNGTSDATCIGSTGVGSQTLAANAAYVGMRWRGYCAGTYSTGLASVAALTVKVKIGSASTSFTTPALPVNVVGLYFAFTETCTVRTVSGTTATAYCTGGVQYSTTTLGAAIVFNPVVTTSSLTFDPTVANKIDLTGAFSSLIGSPSATSVDASIEQLN